MASSLKRRIEAIEARNVKPAPRAPFDAQVLQRKLDAIQTDRQAFAALSTEEKLALKLAQLAEARDRKPGVLGIENPALTALRIRLLELDIEELRGADAEEIEFQRLDAHCQVGGRRWEKAAEPVEELSLDPEDDSPEPEELVIGRQAGPVTTRDRLDGYRNEGRLAIEPRYV